MSHNHPDLSIVIPAYNEERRIKPTLEALSDFLSSDTYFKLKDVEVIVVTAYSPDKTKSIVDGERAMFKNFKFLEPGPRQGKGRDVQYGILRASGDYVVFMDADLATPLHHLEEFYNFCKAGDDLVIGTRNLLIYRSNLWRDVFSWAGNLFYRFSGGIWVEDTQCGFKMFTSEAAKLCFSKQTIMGWGFDIEILAIAKANGLKIKSVRLNDWQHMPYSTYTEGALQITVRSIRDFWHVSVNRIRGSYK